MGDPVKRRIWLVFALILALGVTAFFVVRSAEDKVTADMPSCAGRFAIRQIVRFLLKNGPSTCSEIGAGCRHRRRPSVGNSTSLVTPVSCSAPRASSRLLRSECSARPMTLQRLSATRSCSWMAQLR